MRFPPISLLLCLLAVAARGQFYAPATEFHDPCQRRFPVEAARVLAWMRNADDGAKIAEVTYRVETTPARETVWTIEWKENGGRVARTVALRYEEGALLNGAQWYREVWKQLTAKGWTVAKGGGEQGKDAFWKGAEEAGLSRMDAVAAALKLAPAGPAANVEMARLAGVLAQGATPSVGLWVTLDATLLARSAAWLCAAEARSGKSHGAEWGPILCLSGRDAAAREAWAMAKVKPATEVQRFWDLLIRLPAAAEALETVSRPENRRYAAPLFVAYSHIDREYGVFLVDVGPKLYAAETWGQLHDYGQSLNRAGENRGPGVKDFPARGFRAWLGVLREMTGSPENAAIHERAMQVKDFEGGRNELAAPSAELAQLLNEGCHNDGPLAPVAVVAVADVLGFGWEQGGHQIGMLHTIFSILATSKETARKMEKEWFAVVEAWSPFTQNLKLPPFKPLADNARYESITSSNVAKELIAHPPTAWVAGKEDPETYFQRRWLMDPHRALEYLVRHGGDRPLARQLLERTVSEAGPCTLGALLTIDNHWMDVRGGQWVFDQAVDALHFRDELVKAVPGSVIGRWTLIEAQFADGSDPLGYAQAMERLHWESGLAFAPHKVYLAYVRANALEAAKRFYDRWGGAVSNRYRFHTTLGSANFALALLENDPARIRKALADLGGTTSHLPEITAAILADDLAGARRRVDDWLKKWPKGNGVPIYQALGEYLPLIPALADPKSAEHRRALTEFPKDPYFLFLKWTLAQKAHLSADDAITFFSDEDEEAQLVVAALRKDRATFEKLYEQIQGPREDPNAGMLWVEANQRREDAKAVLYAWLRNQLLATPAAKDVPELRPAKAEPLLPRLQSLAKKS